MKNLALYLVFVFFLFSSSISAQEETMNTDQEYLHPETALIITGVGSGTFNALDLPEDPIEKLEEIRIIVPLQIRQQLEGEVSSTPWTSVGAFSFLITQLYDVSGGILYNIIPSAHYATKELQHLGLLPRNVHPRQPISTGLASEILEKVELMLEKGDIR